ncbi:MAG TPA: AgmX/PglI C-terminal domain-containing protein, partial [Polyangiales bacterium]|nr:AgmX/PglI C-terminal domain-containing protein [Polyangiales bacterium]
VGELAELASLLRRNRDASRPMRGRPPPNVPGPGATGSRPAPLPVPAAPAPEEYEEDNAEPTRISEFTPSMALALPSQTAPQHVAAASTGGTSPKVFVPQAVASAPLPEVSTQVIAAPTSGQGRNANWTMLAVGLLGGIVIVSAPLIFQHWWSSPDKPAQAAVATAPEKPAPQQSAPVEVDVPSDEPVMEIKPDEVAANKPARTGGTAKPAVAAKTEPAKPAGKTLSDEQRKLLERMGGGTSDPDLKNLARSADEPRSGGPVASELTPQQLTKVVQDNKNQLQRCYETALRAAGGKQDSAIKISVNVLVGGSGTAKSVSTTGDGLGNMTDCIRSAVKHWRFPQAQSESEFAFPLVFQPGA